MRKFARIAQWIIMAVVLALLLAHILKWEKIQVDGTTIALLGILLVIPLIEFIRKIRIGEFEAEIAPKEIAKIKAKASDELALLPKNFRSESELYSSIIDLVRQDPQLGLAKLRIELEKILKSLFKLGDEERRVYSPKMGYLLDKLSKSGNIPSEIVAPLKDVISVSNRAVHGHYVRAQDAEELALLGIQLLAELKDKYREKALKPIKSNIISNKEVERLRSSKYRVTTVIPLVDKPQMKVYILDQDNLEDFLEGYYEYAEFIVSVERLNSKEKQT